MIQTQEVIKSESHDASQLEHRYTTPNNEQSSTGAKINLSNQKLELSLTECEKEVKGRSLGHRVAIARPNEDLNKPARKVKVLPDIREDNLLQKSSNIVQNNNKLIKPGSQQVEFSADTVMSTKYLKHDSKDATVETKLI